MTPQDIGRQEDIRARQHPRLHRLSHMSQRWLIWYLPQILCCMALGALLTLFFIGAVLQCPHP